KHALGLLLAGETPSPRLFAAADYLLTFPLVAFRSSPSEEALLNATALALCGYLCDGQHPEASLWRLTGCARLANEAHLRRAALEDRMLADCLLAVCRVADELDLPILADLLTLRERMWGRLLDHGRAERLHVPEAEYPQHMRAPIPAGQIGAQMRDRAWQYRTQSPDETLTADLADADATCRNLITLRAHMLVRHQFGSDVDWHAQFFADIESTVSLNFQPFIRNLATAYHETGDPKYAEHAARLMWSWYRQCPEPRLPRVPDAGDHRGRADGAGAGRRAAGGFRAAGREGARDVPLRGPARPHPADVQRLQPAADRPGALSARGRADVPARRFPLGRQPRPARPGAGPGEGAAPDHASHAWPAAGYYVMRDQWGPDGQFLFFDGAAWGASHQHEDKLTFTLYAGGRLLIGDPNIYSYSPTELTHYFKASRSHNVVMVDGRGQARRFRPESHLSTLGRNEWVSQPEFDFVSSEYLEGFAADPFPGRGDASEVDMGIRHRRAILYVKPIGAGLEPAQGGDRKGSPLPGYWILCDLLTSQDAEPHTLEQIFHLAPIEQPGAAEPLRPGEVAVSPATIVTHEPGLGNLALLPVDPTGLDVRAQKGETSPAVGWYGVYGEFPAWDVTLQRRTPLPARLDAVHFPLRPGETAYPTVTRLRADAQVTAFRIQGAGVDDTFILCEEGAGPVTVAGVTCAGRAVLARRQPKLQVLTVEAL
ncbi:MAG: hypothetical protein FJ011_25690, partial [Chloroflexi bacterium]|nr:hypothetical protein [Chloroflexota bacterium]